MRAEHDAATICIGGNYHRPVLGSTISGSRISSRSRVLALGLVPKVLRMRSPVTRNLKVSHVSLVTLLHPVGPPVRRIVRPHPENDRQHKNNHADDLQR